MKLSICLPVYNYSPKKLIKALIAQADELNIDYEIIVYDDGSNEFYINKNSKLPLKFNRVQHHYNINNFGRSFARNYLANRATGTHILFIDADSEPKNSDYLETYLKYLDFPVVCGGTYYPQVFTDKKKQLRYIYGINREMIPAKKRNKNPNRAFATNNFLIQKSVFEKVKFREFLKKYGHEDSLFGYELKSNNFKILHIDNPVIHVGIEDNRVFVSKTLEGIRNLIKIQNNKEIPPDFIKDIRLIRKSKQMIFLKPLIVFIYNRYSKRIHYHLFHSTKPKLFIFDLYKLANYYKLKNSKI